MSKILIIEDEEAIADLEKDYLELSGFEVEIANRGDVGLQKALYCVIHNNRACNKFYFLSKKLRKTNCYNDLSPGSLAAFSGTLAALLLSFGMRGVFSS